MLRSLLRALLLSVAALQSPGSFAARPTQGAQTPRVGVQVKIETFTQQDADAIARTGFEFVRFGVWTNHLGEPAYVRRVASAFETAAHARLPVLLTMRSTAPIGDTRSPEATRMMAEGRRFGEQVVRVARQYAPQLVGVELWNEPDLDRYWPTGDVAATFPAFMQGVCGALATSPPTTPIYGFGFSRAPVGMGAASSLLDSVLTASPRCIAAASYHAYGMTTAQIGDAAREIRSKYAMPTLITEWGVPSQGSANSSTTAQASRIRSFLAALRTSDVPLVSIYEWKDTASASTERERGFGLVDATGADKPALRAVRDYLTTAPRSLER